LTEKDEIKIIIGLGNPGRKYARTRHNVGFMVLDAFASRCSTLRTKKTLDYIRTELEFGPAMLTAIKPMRYMNCSGDALLKTGINWAGGKSSILVIYDDVDLEFGRIRLRRSGSSGGHKGMKNIIDVLGTREIARLRVGIGSDPDSIMTDYVLKPFGKEERGILPDVLELAADAVQAVVESGVENAMNDFNNKCVSFDKGIET